MIETKHFKYKGENTSVTLNVTVDVILRKDEVIELPVDNDYVQSLLAQGLVVESNPIAPSANA